MRPLSFRFSSLVVCGALAVVACGNISLSSSASGFNAPTTSGFNDTDAATDGGPPALVGASPDAAGSPPPITGNPLCNYGFANTASHTCSPDSVPAEWQCTADAGAFVEASALPEPQADSGAPSGDDGGGGGTASDAGAAATIDAGPQSCHVVQVSAADGSTSSSQACLANGPGNEGDQCQVSTDCAATYECVGMPGQCRHYCCDGNSVCSTTYTASFCDVQSVVSGKFDVPVCMPISGCSLFGKCPPTQTCAVVKDDGTTSCVTIGTAQVGEACDETHCAAGLTCLGNDGSRTCFELCHVDSPADCPSGTTCTGSAQLFKDPQFGICQ